MAEKEIKTESGEAVEQPVETPVVPEAEKKKAASKKQSVDAPECSGVVEPFVTQDENGGLKTLDELALTFRTPSWMQGGLLRLMGWAKDKMVTEDEYGRAVERLSGRKLGGGRL